MVAPKLQSLLSTIARNDLFLLREFVHSPIHNKNKQVQNLLDFLLKHHPQFLGRQFTKEGAFEAILPNKPFSDLQLRHAASLLLKATEQFLVWKQISDNPAVADRLLLTDLRERNLPKHFSGALRAARRNQEQTVLRDINYYYQEFCIESEVEAMRAKQEDRTAKSNLQQVSANLDIFFLANKLQLTTETGSYEAVSSPRYELKLVGEVLEHLRHTTYDLPLITLYHSALLTLTEPGNETHFSNLKRLLEAHREELPKPVLQTLHTHARNYAIRKGNSGRESDYFPVLLELYELGLERGLLLDVEGYMSPGVYKNMVGLGLYLNLYDWVETCIDRYTELLPANDRSGMESFNRAKLQFAKGNYKAVVGLLNEVDYSNLFLRMDARVLLIKTWYELGDTDALESLLESFKQLVVRNKQLSYHRENYLNIVALTQAIVRLDRTAGDKTQTLRKRIEATEALTEKRWLLDKLPQHSGSL